MAPTYPTWHLTQLTPTAAMRHARLTHGLADKPEVGIGWTPYTFLATHGAISQWACHTEAELVALLASHGLVVAGWSEWSNGVRSTILRTPSQIIGEDVMRRVHAGEDIMAALKAVCGDAVVDGMVSDLYNELRAQAVR